MYNIDYNTSEIDNECLNYNIGVLKFYIVNKENNISSVNFDNRVFYYKNFCCEIIRKLCSVNISPSYFIDSVIVKIKELIKTNIHFDINKLLYDGTNIFMDLTKYSGTNNIKDYLKNLVSNKILMESDNSFSLTYYNLDNNENQFTIDIHDTDVAVISFCSIYLLEFLKEKYKNYNIYEYEYDYYEDCYFTKHYSLIMFNPDVFTLFKLVKVQVNLNKDNAIASTLIHNKSGKKIDILTNRLRINPFTKKETMRVIKLHTCKENPYIICVNSFVDKNYSKFLSIHENIYIYTNNKIKELTKECNKDALAVKYKILDLNMDKYDCELLSKEYYKTGNIAAYEPFL